MTAHGAVLAIWNDRDDAIADLYERWYLTEHLPERLGVPGFVAAQRHEALQGSPRFFTHYDVASVDVLSSPEYLARLAAPSPLTRQVMAQFRNMVRTACTVLHRSPGAALGGCAAVAFVEQPAAVRDDLLKAQAIEAERDPRAMRVQAWRAAHDPAHAATRESLLRPGGGRRIAAALVVDVLREADGWALKDRLAGALHDSLAGDAAQPVQFNVYRLLGQWQAG